MASDCPEIWGVKTFVIEDTLKAQALKVLEEAAELLEAVKDYEREASKPEPEEWMIGACESFMRSELADVLQATLNLAAAFGYDQEEVERDMDMCECRNRMRGRLK